MFDGNPTPEQLLSSLVEISSSCRFLALIWHSYYAILIILFTFGVKKKTNHWLASNQSIGILLGLPFISISLISWLYFNPFNGSVFTIISTLIIVFSIRMPKKKVQIAPQWAIIVGTFMVIFGWIYPSSFFINITSFSSYLYEVPLGVIPCPTLSITIGLILIFDNLGSHKMSLIFGLIGIMYGILGSILLKVLIDWVLFIGAVIIFTKSFFIRKNLKRCSY